MIGIGASSITRLVRRHFGPLVKFLAVAEHLRLCSYLNVKLMRWRIMAVNVSLIVGHIVFDEAIL